MNRITPRYRAPLHFPVWLMVDDDAAPIVGEMNPGRRKVIVLYNDGGQIGERIGDGEEVLGEDVIHATVFDDAASLIPVIEQLLSDGVALAVYGLLPDQQAADSAPDELHLHARGQEPLDEFLARLKERKAQDDNSASN